MGYIRFLLAVVVAIGHTEFGHAMPIVGGVAAVEGFFLISGFYMAATYTRNYSGQNQALLFLVSRGIRLYPLYLAILLASAAYVLLAHVFGWRLNSYGTLNYFLTTDVSKPHAAVWSLLLQDIVSIDPVTHLELPVRQAWSVSAEIVFYAMVPLLCRFQRALLALTIVLFAFKIALFFFVGWRYAYFPFFGQLGYFTLGMWIYFVRERLTWSRSTSLVFTGGVTAVCLLTGQASFEFGALWQHALFIGCLALATPSVFAHLRGSLSNKLGDLSYGIYLSHLLVLEILFSSGVFRWGTHLILCAVATVVISSAVAWAFEVIVQDRLDRWRRRTFYARGAEPRHGYAVTV